MPICASLRPSTIERAHKWQPLARAFLRLARTSIQSCCCRSFKMKRKPAEDSSLPSFKPSSAHTRRNSSEGGRAFSTRCRSSPSQRTVACIWSSSADGPTSVAPAPSCEATPEGEASMWDESCFWNCLLRTNCSGAPGTAGFVAFEVPRLSEARVRTLKRFNASRASARLSCASAAAHLRSTASSRGLFGVKSRRTTNCCANGGSNSRKTKRTDAAAEL
mmetsp:Transcript_82487/g.229984  ORF Transcript_82487/g.229984 Transcript_82487/m.229984 type:complete len:219 (-) Transcript_82487:26-682(-)